MMLRTFQAVALAAFLLEVSAYSQQRGPKVLLLFDMEGVSGINTFKSTSISYPTEYAEGRKLLTADVNAAIAGLKAGGAREIVVVDGHGSGNTEGPDVLEEQLLAPARMHQRDTPFDVYMDSYDHSIDAIVAVGMHAGAGNRQGFLSHTYSGVGVECRVNGIPFCEGMLLAMGAGRLKIPLIAMSGDDQLEKETRRNLPWVRYAIVRRAIDRLNAESIASDDSARRIEAAVHDGLAQFVSAAVPDFPGPYRFAVTFADQAQANIAALVPGAELAGTSVEIRTNDFEELSKKCASS